MSAKSLVWRRRNRLPLSTLAHQQQPSKRAVPGSPKQTASKEIITCCPAGHTWTGAMTNRGRTNKFHNLAFLGSLMRQPVVPYLTGVRAIKPSSQVLPVNAREPVETAVG